MGKTEAMGCRIKNTVVSEELDNAKGKGICEGRWSGDVRMDSASKMGSRVGHLGVE